jgi:16S rRNA (guanine527-N7)-methyltransferase
MDIGSPEWEELIREGAAQQGIPVTPEQASCFSRHARELLIWNPKINLTAITRPEDVAVKHFLDAIIPVRILLDTPPPIGGRPGGGNQTPPPGGGRPGGGRIIPHAGKVLDIGSGGGFPGIPLKIMLPDLSVTLIDSVRKKVSFLNQVIRTLKLKNIQAIHARAEDLAESPEFALRFDLIISRALAPLDEFIRLALPFLKKGGLILAMKGNISKEEITAAHKLNIAGMEMTVERYLLPVINSDRTLVKMVI